MMRSVSGPSGRVENNRFVFDEVRSRFVYPQDKSFVVYFEWDTAPGMHVWTGIWKQPDGTAASMSPDVKIQAATRGVARRLELPGSRLRPPCWRRPSRPPNPSGLNPRLRRWTTSSGPPRHRWSGYKVDEAGRRTDTASGFVFGKDRIVTAFQAVDASISLEVEFAGGRKAAVKDLLAWSQAGARTREAERRASWGAAHRLQY